MGRWMVRTAAGVLAELPLEELRDQLSELGNEPDAEGIADLVVRRRGVRPITTTGQLVDLVFEAKKMSRRQWKERPAERRGDLHPAARTFQALRMLVNDELGGLAQFLRMAPYCLKPGGRLGIISFHSGEDLRVEESLRQEQGSGTLSKVSDDPIRPSAKEVAANPRSRSALFRWAVK